MITEPLPEMLRDSRSQMIMLQILSQRKAATVSEMAAAMGVAVPTASTMVRKMVEKGLLERNRDQDDGRSTRISLSSAGMAFVHAMMRRRAQAIEPLLAPLSEADLATLREAMEILEAISGNAL